MYAWSRGDLADRAPPIIAGQTDAAAAVLGGKKRTRRTAGVLSFGTGGNESEDLIARMCHIVIGPLRHPTLPGSPPLGRRRRRRRRRLVLRVLYPLVRALRPTRHFARVHAKTRRWKINRTNGTFITIQNLMDEMVHDRNIAEKI